MELAYHARDRRISATSTWRRKNPPRHPPSRSCCAPRMRRHSVWRILRKSSKSLLCGGGRPRPPLHPEPAKTVKDLKLRELSSGGLEAARSAFASRRKLHTDVTVPSLSVLFA